MLCCQCYDDADVVALLTLSTLRAILEAQQLSTPGSAFFAALLGALAAQRCSVLFSIPSLCAVFTSAVALIALQRKTPESCSVSTRHFDAAKRKTRWKPLRVKEKRSRRCSRVNKCRSQFQAVIVSQQSIRSPQKISSNPSRIAHRSHGPNTTGQDAPRHHRQAR